MFGNYIVEEKTARTIMGKNGSMQQKNETGWTIGCLL